MTRRKVKIVTIRRGATIIEDDRCDCCQRYKHVGDTIFVLHGNAICQSCVAALSDAFLNKTDSDN